MLPQAKTLMTRVPAVASGDPPRKVLSILKEHGVVVLVDGQGRPRDILTPCDLDQVKDRVGTGLGAGSDATKLFTAAGRDVHTVLEDDPSARLPSA